MGFNKNKKSSAQAQAGRDYALSDEILASTQALCDSTLRAFKQKRVDEYALGANRLQRINSVIGRFGRELTKIAKRTDQENVAAYSTAEEYTEDGSYVAMLVQNLCSEFTQLMAAGRTEEARALIPYLREIKARCSGVEGIE